MPDITPKFVAKLASRGPVFTLGGTRVVECVHGREKRSNEETFDCTREDFAEGRVHVCGCCDNFFVNRSDRAAVRCPDCTPTPRREAT